MGALSYIHSERNTLTNATFETVAQRSFTRDADIQPESRLLFRFIFKHLRQLNRTLDEFMRNLIFLRLATRNLRLIPITALAIIGYFTATNVAYGQQDVVRIPLS